jgi:hypothetical protein
MSETRTIIQKAIKRVLSEHVDQPFLFLREIGLQARLWCLLREELKDIDCEVCERPRQTPLFKFTNSFQTSRVQLESKVGGPEKSDLVVLRADPKPRLTCHAYGPTDVVAHIDPKDVEAVIEMKAAPSWYPKNRQKFAADMRKLSNLQTKSPGIQCYFVLIDKSVAVPGAASERCRSPEEEWCCDLHLQDSPGEGVTTFIEVWDLACNPPIPRLRFSAQGGDQP